MRTEIELLHSNYIFKVIIMYRVSLSGNPGNCGSEPAMVGLAPKWIRLDPKLDKSGAFSDQISVHLAREPSPQTYIRVALN